VTTAAAPAAPTLAEVGRAAAVLLDDGAEEVLLFGSVAAGTATPASDIDLVAIYADLDYSQRAARRQVLEAAAAAAAAPWPVQVHVTDRPEWRARIDNVPTSLERRIHNAAVVVAAASERGPVNWNKEMALPMSDAHEALRQFDHWVLPRLSELEAATHRGTQEVDTALAPEVAERARLERMVRICATAAITAETAIKALAVLHGKPTPSEKELRRAGHNIAACLDLLPTEARHGPADVLDDLGVDVVTLSQWRLRGTYTADVADDGAIADGLAETYTTMATTLTALLANELRKTLGANADLAAAEARRAHLGGVIARRDVRRGIEDSELDV
jgi:predicted nucleotidyltransferase